MILVTGATGFIGRALLRELASQGMRVRILIHPGPHSPRLPRGVSLDIALSGLNDHRGLRAALVGVDRVIHLSGSAATGREDLLYQTDVLGTRTLAQAASEAGVERFLYLSHLGAGTSSAYPVLRASALAERHIERSGLAATIIRSAVVYGAGDHFTTSLAMLLAASPLIFPLPGDGANLLQPLWVGDLVTCLLWALDDPATTKRRYEIGGPEFISLRQIVEFVQEASGLRRMIVPVPPPWLRAISWLMSVGLRWSPTSPFMIDYLAANRTATLDSLPREFGLQPARMQDHLEHLSERRWFLELLRRQISRGRRD